ncbi:FtsK/SpoIIIE domain-containing protein [Actinoplanes sp. NPDC049265]|uniref:FtsK/SpoIIIE domain-containing protein n=1 Tax=Actinoplanes sp. NPDC049265 TaxID=3363902 RepID=UPI00371731AA
MTTALHEARLSLPPGAVELACHAAVPVALDPGFLHLLRINFFQDPPEVLPHDAEAALLTSPLFQELGDGLYEVEPALRDRLLSALVAAYGPGRLTKVAVLLEQYTNRADPWPLRELDYAQRLTALSIVHPDRAATWLDRAAATSAAGPLAREWYVAMRTLLDHRPPTLAADVRAALGTTDVRRLGELALLPGADVLSLVRRLQTIAMVPGPEAAAAGRMIQHVTAVIPPPRVPSLATSAQDRYIPLVPLLSPAPLGSDDVEGLRQRDPRTRPWRHLRVPIGRADDGGALELDLKPRSDGGAGPHALIIGATGSGKSELLRTVVLALAITHRPDEVQFAFVTLLGPAPFAEFEDLPHTAAMMTNLLADAHPARRGRYLLSPLAGELDRRLAVLRVAGHPTHRSFQAARGSSALPSLIVVADDFTEIIAADPHAREVLLAIAEAGAYAGMHLVLTNQRAGDGRLLGLGDHSTVRIALRTESEADSIAILGTAGAAHLPRVPGQAFFRSGGTRPIPFRVAYVSARRPAELTRWTGILHEVAFPDQQDTELVATVRRLAALDPPVPRFFVDGETRSATLGDELGPAGPTPERGFQVLRPDLERTSSLPVTPSSAGPWVRVDQPVVVGGPSPSRRTTALETLACGLALTRTPDEADIALLALDSGGLMRLADLPHVFVAANLTQAGRIYHLFAILRLVLGQPVAIGSLLKQPALNRPTFVIIDGLGTLLRFFPDLRPLTAELLRFRPDRQIHLITTEAGMVVTELGTRVDLTDVEPLLPTLPADDRTPGSDAREIAQLADRYWSGLRPSPPPPPGLLQPAELAEVRPSDPLSYVVGRELLTSIPAEIDFTNGTGLLVVGGRSSGKTALLRLLATSILRRYARDGGARLVVLDPEGALSDLRDDPADRRDGMIMRPRTGSAAESRRLIAEVAEVLRGRLPTPNPDAEAFRGRSDWTGAEIFVLVDDLDELDGRGGTLQPLLPFLPEAADVGLHLLVAHAMTDRERLMRDEATRALIELSATQVLLSGTPRPSPVLGEVIPIPLPPLVGRLIVRYAPLRTVQFAYEPPSAAGT